MGPVDAGGVLIGVYLFLRRNEETEPATDPAPVASGRLVPSA